MQTKVGTRRERESLIEHESDTTMKPTLSKNPTRKRIQVWALESDTHEHESDRTIVNTSTNPNTTMNTKRKSNNNNNKHRNETEY